MKSIKLKPFAIVSYFLLLVPVAFCFVETIAYPGFWLNKVNLDIDLIIIIFSLIYFIFYLTSKFYKKNINHHQAVAYCSYTIIFTTLSLTVIESLTFPNFIFYYSHINYLALQTLSVFLVFILVLNNVQFALFFQNNLHRFKLINKRLIIVFLLLSPILSSLIWKNYLLVNGLQSSHSANFSAMDQASLSNQFRSFFIHGTTNYDSLPIFFGLAPTSLAVWHFLLAILLYLNWRQSKKSKSVKFFLLSLYAGSLIYVSVNIVSCVAMFSIGELKNSLIRYNLTYLLGLILFSIFIHIYYWTKNNSKNSLINYFYIAIILLLINPFNISSLKMVKRDDVKKRTALLENYQELIPFLNKDTRLHVISDDVMGIRYYLAPIKVLTPIWQSHSEYMLSNPEFSQATHVYIDQSKLIHEQLNTEQKQQIFLNMENIQNDSLYEVVRDEFGHFTLNLIYKRGK